MIKRIASGAAIALVLASLAACVAEVNPPSSSSSTTQRTTTTTTSVP